VPLTYHLPDVAATGSSSMQALSTIDLMKKRLAENAKAAGAPNAALGKDKAVTTKERAELEKRTPTKMMQFESEAADEPRLMRQRNTSQQRSTIFSTER